MENCPKTESFTLPFSKAQKLKHLLEDYKGYPLAFCLKVFNFSDFPQILVYFTHKYNGYRITEARKLIF